MSPPATEPNLALFTDLYELTMLQAYVAEGMHDEAVFSLFVRRLPERRNFLIAAGLESVLDALEKLRFEADDIAYLRSLGQFDESFLAWLADFRFTGEVRAVAEGTPVFADEPILEVRAPLPEAQLVETLIMNQVHLQTVLATKAWRVVRSAEGRPVVDFGPRRMHGLDAALKAARAFHIAGVTATSNVLAGKLYGVPVTGTMAHSYIQAHDDERAAFKLFAERYPGTILLIDTYDTIDGVEKVINLVRERKLDVRGVRLDSGDLGWLAKEVRARLDAGGLPHVEVFASGGLDEDAIADLLGDGAPIDGFGVGTSMGVSRDAPDLDIAYKLAWYGGRGRLKLATGKPILPGAKQVFRRFEGETAGGDVIARAEEELDGEPLLATVMTDGRRVDGGGDLEAVRAHCAEATGRLPATVRALAPAEPAFAVDVSAALARYRDEVTQAVKR
ncbi:MAG: nicotinate phosphoribosyltransferase [Alphaproteobacteria bacterium]|jgi:nicotinate phosphoribosyltransferase|nr:nicotinate phosphoribosyltransferase [Alphaproteobacteria bacterium]